MGNIDRDTVKKIGQLCRLNLSEEDLDKFTYLFTDTLEHIDTLKELNTVNVNETYQVNGLTNVYMKDSENIRTLTQQESLSCAKEVVRMMFCTDAVFERN